MFFFFNIHFLNEIETNNFQSQIFDICLEGAGERLGQVDLDGVGQGAESGGPALPRDLEEDGEVRGSQSRPRARLDVTEVACS